MNESEERTWRDGWAWLIAASSARAYLALLFSLAAFALLPALFGLTGSVVQSGSMEPRISPGDVVLSRALPSDVPAPLGHVISFMAPEGSAKPGMVLHRLVGVNDDGTLITRGDANAAPDSTGLERQNVVSQAGLLIPWVGLPSFWVAHGQSAQLALWLLGTTVALVIAVFDREYLTGPDDKRPIRQPGRKRRWAAIVAVTVAGAGFAAAPAPSSNAAFTASADAKSSGWGSSTAFTAGPSAAYTVIARRIASTSSTTITGNVAATESMTGFSPGYVNGSTDMSNSAAAEALSDVNALHTSLSRRPATTIVPGVLTGTVGPGTYASPNGVITVTSALTFDARSNANAVFVILSPTRLSVSQPITLVNGARAANIYWVTGLADLGASAFSGTVLASSDITVARNGVVRGRLFTNSVLSLNRATIGP